MMTRGNILLVDDDPDLMALLSMRLSIGGYQVYGVASAEAALARLELERPNLVITDVRLGGMDGMALFDRIHTSYPTLPVIVLTAHGSIPDAVAATSSGVFGYLTKPFDGHVLMEKIEQAMALPVQGGASPPARVAWRADLVSGSPRMEELLAEAQLVAASEASVLICGASGTGKELLAKALHRASPRYQRPFVAVNCGAIPEPLLESELFGHVKGAFTGATQTRGGLFQAANGGTLFLDEIGDMPLPLQVKLLRVLQEMVVRPVGSTVATPVDVRIVSATHRDLDQAMQDGTFREDLFYRLNVVRLTLPTLAERREDIPLLAAHFLSQRAKRFGKPIKGFSTEALDHLMAASWPGNVRQLYNVVEQCCALATTSLIPLGLVQKAMRERSGDVLPYEEAKRGFERSYLADLLKRTGGNVTDAARLAQRNRTDFYRLLHRSGLPPELFKQGRDVSVSPRGDKKVREKTST